jgi:tripartite-type tricarboxylate transporter receptor subunit TctC
VVGFAAGGPTDVLARLVPPIYQEQLGQPVVVENRPGAAGNIGSEAVARSPGDGHTMLVANVGQVAINPHTYPNMPFDPRTDLVPVALMTTGSLLLVAHSSLGTPTMADLIALLKREPDRHKFATSGAGGIAHVVTELWRQRAGVDITPMHFRGTAAAIPELLAGRVRIFMDGVQMLGEHVQAGRFHAMFTTASARQPLLPQAPTTAELGMPDIDFTSWFGLFAPRGTPQPVIDRLVAVNRRALETPNVRERLAAGAVTASPSTQAELAERTTRDYNLYGEAVRSANIRADA